VSCQLFDYRESQKGPSKASAARPFPSPVRTAPIEMHDGFVEMHDGLDGEADSRSLLLAFYRGRSPVSRLIRLVNWGPYSHVAVGCFETGHVWEAWHRGGVSRVDSWDANHTANTLVDLFAVHVTTEQRALITGFLNSQVGKPYDFLGCLHFVTRRPEYAWQQRLWFCSELAHAAFIAGGIHLLARVPSYKVYPAMLSYSPLLRPLGSIVTVSVPAPDSRLPTPVSRLPTPDSRFPEVQPA